VVAVVTRTIGHAPATTRRRSHAGFAPATGANYEQTTRARFLIPETSVAAQVPAVSTAVHANCNYSNPFVVTILIKLAVEQRKDGVPCSVLTSLRAVCLHQVRAGRE
jgi:hypothetical protein